jgi:hypothetical protein
VNQTIPELPTVRFGLDHVKATGKGQDHAAEIANGDWRK